MYKKKNNKQKFEAKFVLSGPRTKRLTKCILPERNPSMNLQFYLVTISGAQNCKTRHSGPTFPFPVNIFFFWLFSKNFENVGLF